MSNQTNLTFAAAAASPHLTSDQIAPRNAPRFPRSLVLVSSVRLPSPPYSVLLAAAVFLPVSGRPDQTDRLAKAIHSLAAHATHTSVPFIIVVLVQYCTE
jgi:hypothetical protein